MACATLYVVSKILRSHKHLRHILFEPHEPIKTEKEDISKVKDNLPYTEDVQIIGENLKIKDEEDTIMLSNVMIGAEATSETEPDVKVEMEITKSYDPFCRNPLYAGVTKGFNTELVALSKHFHPSVVLFANAIIQGITRVPRLS